MYVPRPGNCPDCGDPIDMHDLSGCHVWKGDGTCDCRTPFAIETVPAPAELVS